MRELNLIRHGLTPWNESGQFQGQTDIELSEQGIKQAETIQERFVKHNFDFVYASPLKRAKQTAEIALPNRDIIFDDRLKEVNFGIFEGYDLAANQQRPEWDVWYADTFKRRAPEGESYEDLRLRAVDWLEDLPEGRIAAFCHSGTIQMLISHIAGVEYPRWRKRFYLRHGSISRVLYKDGHVMIERLNDCRHMSAMKLDPFDE